MSIFGRGFIEDSVRSGRAYRLSIFRQTLAATNLFKLMITNPSASGMNMVVQSATTDSYASVVASLSVYRNPTGGLPTTAITTAASSLGIITPLNNNSVIAAVATVLGLSDLATNPYTGGTMTQQKPIYTNQPTKSDETIVILKPGTSLALTFGGGVAADFAYNFIWSEENQ